MLKLLFAALRGMRCKPGTRYRIPTDSAYAEPEYTTVPPPPGYRYVGMSHGQPCDCAGCKWERGADWR